MSPRYLPAAALSSSYLNASTPIGLFQSYRDGKPSNLFLVTEAQDARHATVLNEQGGNSFRSWRLEPDADAWSGVSLGPVVLEVDTSTAVLGHSGSAELGDVTIATSGYWIASQIPSVSGTSGTRVGDTVTGAVHSPSHVFRRWRLVQHNDLGEATVLFEQAPPAAVGRMHII